MLRSRVTFGQALPSRGAADLVIGGPPCQGFSVAGRMDPNDPRSRHVWDFLGVVARVKPRVFVMENVKALAVNRRWAQLLRSLVSEAEGMGYLTQLLILNASHFGVPQARERMFLIGRTEGASVAPVPVSAGVPPTVRTALKGLPRYGEAGNDTFCRAIITTAKNPVLRRSPYAGMLFNGQGRPLSLDRPATTLPASMGGNRTPIVSQLSLDGKDDGWVEKYHAHLWAGGEPHESVPEHLRRLTVEEAAALQTFPIDVEWGGGQNAAYRQIGNAVPPALAYHVALAVRRSLGLAELDADETTDLSHEVEELLQSMRSLVPVHLQLSLDVEESIAEYAKDGNSERLRRAIDKVTSGDGLVKSL